jgi:signal transduction histidine kinase/ActR/RegA family two-component response regulator
MADIADRKTDDNNAPANWRQYLLIAALTVVYFFAGKFGLHFFGLIHPSASAVWPPTGVAIAALLLFGYRVWPAVFIGAFLVNVTTAGSIATSIGVATGNTLEGIAAAYLVIRFAGGRHAFARPRDIFRFVGLAAVVSTTISATIGVTTLALGGYAPWHEFVSIWVTWWLGDAAGAILVTPMLILWSDKRDESWNGRRAGEAALLLGFVVAVGLLIGFAPALAPYPRAFLCLPPLVWAAFRFGTREVATAVAILSAIAAWATTNGSGPFAMSTPNESLLVLQTFMIIMAVTALPMAALVAERAALLQRERAARELAENANRTKDEFLAMLSHELRNPLGAISGAAAVLERIDATGETGRWRMIIQRQTEHLTRLIEDLLDIARITASKMVLKPRPTDLAEVAERCVRALNAASDFAQHRLELQLLPVWVNADPDRVTQIISNLIANALKYTRTNDTIRVRTSAEGAQALLCIEDTGVGIPPELLRRVFDAFTQGEQDLARTQGGLGIGLTLVRRLAEMQGGSVEVRSDGAGRGSTFVVRLPRVEAPASAQATPSISPASPTRGYRILLIEDNVDSRQALRALLEIEGHDVHEAPDGNRGIHAAATLRPEFALIDIGLPGLDGYAVAERIKATNRAIRLIALTGYGRDDDKRRAQAAGFDAHLLKPIDPERLQAIMNQLAGAKAFVPRPATPQPQAAAISRAPRV